MRYVNKICKIRCNPKVNLLSLLKEERHLFSAKVKIEINLR